MLRHWWNHDRVVIAPAEGRGSTLEVGQQIVIERRMLTIAARAVNTATDPLQVRYVATEDGRSVNLIAAHSQIGFVDDHSPTEWYHEDRIQILDGVLM